MVCNVSLDASVLPHHNMSNQKQVAGQSNHQIQNVFDPVTFSHPAFDRGSMIIPFDLALSPRAYSITNRQLSRESKTIQNNSPIRAMTAKVLEPFDEFGKLLEIVMGDFASLKWLVLVGFNLSSVEG